MQSKRPGPHLVSEPVDFNLEYGDNLRESQDAYKRLLGDALRGDQSLFARVDAVMEAWRIVSPIVDTPPRPVSYRQGSKGPVEADVLIPDWEWLTG
jgi:glucose-6-phosphate 1-dehydrogenase